MEKVQGQRVAEGASTFPVKVVSIIAGAVATLGFGGYVALCVMGGGSSILPNTTINGVDVSGMSMTEALDTLESTLGNPYQSVNLVVMVEGAPESFTLSGSVAKPDYQACLTQVTPVNVSFFSQGAKYVSALVAGQSVESVAVFSPDGLVETEALLDELELTMSDSVIQASWEVMMEEEALLIDTGTPGRFFNRVEVREEILATIAASRGDTLLTLTPSMVNPDPVDIDVVHADIFSDVFEASFDAETMEVTPSSVGVDFNTGYAELLLAGAGVGEVVQVPLTITHPKLSSEEYASVLFQDVLGEGISYISGTSDRLTNVTLSAAACHEVILMPGDIFSFNNLVGSCTLEEGYKEGSAFVGGETVLTLGGGVCQTSSTIYLATLNANLKIVERRSHLYAVGYVPDGMDATIYYGSTDFRFQNDTEFPIKVTSVVSGRYISATILGTKTDDIVVNLSAYQKSSTPYTTIYEVDPSLEAGVTYQAIAPYSGRTVEVYRELYNGSISSQNFISSTLESVSTYSSRNEVVKVSPYDAEKYGLTSDGHTLVTPEEDEPSTDTEDTPQEETPEPGDTTDTPESEPDPEPQPESEETQPTEPSTDPSDSNENTDTSTDSGSTDSTTDTQESTPPEGIPTDTGA